MKNHKTIILSFLVLATCFMINPQNSKQSHAGTGAKEMTSISSENDITLSVVFKKHDGFLEVRYQVDNNGPVDCYLLNRLYKTSLAWQFDKDLIYIHFEEDKTVHLMKQIPPVPVESAETNGPAPVAPYSTPVRAGESFKETVKIPLPVREYVEYGSGIHSNLKIKEEMYRQLLFSLGYVLKPDGAIEEEHEINGQKYILFKNPEGVLAQGGVIHSDKVFMELPVLTGKGSNHSSSAKKMKHHAGNIDVQNEKLKYQYREKAVYEKGQSLTFADFSLRYLGERKVDTPGYAPKYFLFYDFEIISGKDTQIVSWAMGGDIAPAVFNVNGKKYYLEKADSISKSLGWLKDNEIVVWTENQYSQQIEKTYGNTGKKETNGKQDIEIKSPVIKAQQRDETLSFSVELLNGTVFPGDDVIMKMILHNPASEAIYANTRFATVPHLGDIRITLTRDRKIVPFKFRVIMAPLTVDKYTLMEPGDTIVRNYNLTRGYDLSPPGSYAVMVRYVNEKIPEELAGEKVFVGHLLIPKPVKFWVKPAPTSLQKDEINGGDS